MEKFTLEPLETDTGTFYGIRGPNQFNTVQPSKETAEFVVKACNNYQQMLEALQWIAHHAEQRGLDRKGIKSVAEKAIELG